jgi:hypothetical protein
MRSGLKLSEELASVEALKCTTIGLTTSAPRSCFYCPALATRVCEGCSVDICPDDAPVLDNHCKRCTRTQFGGLMELVTDILISLGDSEWRLASGVRGFALCRALFHRHRVAEALPAAFPRPTLLNSDAFGDDLIGLWYVRGSSGSSTHAVGTVELEKASAPTELSLHSTSSTTPVGLQEVVGDEALPRSMFCLFELSKLLKYHDSVLRLRAHPEQLMHRRPRRQAGGGTAKKSSFIPGKEKPKRDRTVVDYNALNQHQYPIKKERGQQINETNPFDVSSLVRPPT